MGCTDLNDPHLARLRLLLLVFLAGGILTGQAAFAGTPLRVPERNPIFAGADPHAVVRGDAVWIYPTFSPRGAPQFFAFRSTNGLQSWERHGPVLDFREVKWMGDDGQAQHAAWAPAVIERDGKCFFYYSAGPQGPTPSRIGVAVGESPAGPFRDSGHPLLTGGDGFEAIDPMVFRDPASGKSLLYAGGSAGAKLRVFELNDDLISIAREVPVATPPNFTEGSFMHVRDGIYYLSYSHGGWRDDSYSVHYATAASPTGPWEYRGPMLTSDSRRKGPGHHSIIRSPDADVWFIVYHRWENQAGSGPYRGSRRVAIDRLEYDAKGLLRPVVMTGVEPPAVALTNHALPGVVVDHSPAESGRFIGSPSLVVLTNGDYLASHDFFGPKAEEFDCPVTLVFRSKDRGANWQKVATLPCLFWANLFSHHGAAYLMGTDKHHGRIVLRRSTDGGVTWSEPRDPASGLLTPAGEYHTAPVPVIEHNGRLWRAFEDAMGGTEWGKRYRAGMLSAPVDADLLVATNWTFSNFLPRNSNWLKGDFNAWLEGNAVVAPDGQIVDILRVDTPGLPEKAAIVNLSADGKTASFDPATGFVDFPGGAKKFTIRPDPRGGGYWSLATIVPEAVAGAGRPGGIRNTLALVHSADLRAWNIRCVLLRHPDVAKHGFQYVDWHFEGEDLIAVVRMANDDDFGGARNNHDANHLTFHRWNNFRELTMADSVPMPQAPQVRIETPGFIVTGSGWELGKLADGEPAFTNRRYVWQGVPIRFRGWNFTRTGGGERATLCVEATRGTTLFLATAPSQARMNLSGWSEVPGAGFSYDDAGRTKLNVYESRVAAGETVVVPQGNWTGGLLLLPP